jgi:hypothetical protein
VAPRLELEVLDGLDALAHALGLDEALVPPTGG